MSSTYIDAGGRSAEIPVDVGPGQQKEGGEATRLTAGPRPAVAIREKPRSGRGRLAQALILSLALVTLAGGGSLVAVAILASGSARPTDWRQVNWSLVAGRYQACRQEKPNLGTFGCMTAIGPRPGQSATPQQRGVVRVTAPVQAPPAAAPAQSSVAPRPAAPAQRPAAPSAGATQGTVVSQAPAAPAPAGGGGDDGGDNSGPGGGGGGDD